MLYFRSYALILSLTAYITFAVPLSDVGTTPLAKRGDGSKDYPKKAIFKIEGWEDLAEIDCYIMLCIIGSSVLSVSYLKKNFRS